MLKFKNVSGVDIEIDNLVQIDQVTPDINDGKFLIDQTLDFLKSFMMCTIPGNEDIETLVMNGDIVFVLDGVALGVIDSKHFWSLGVFVWRIKTESATHTYLQTLTEFQTLIVSTLQGLTGEDRLDASAIKNLV